MKHPKFTLLETKTLDHQIREIEERLIVRRYKADLHAAALKIKVNNKIHETLTSPNTLWAATGVGFALGFFGLSDKSKKSESQENCDTQSRRYVHEEEHHSLLSKVLSAWPVIELIISLIPEKKQPDNEDTLSAEEKADIFRDEVLTDAVLSGSSMDEVLLEDAAELREYVDANDAAQKVKRPKSLH